MKLHIGCGSRVIEGWRNADIQKADHVDYVTPAHDFNMIQDGSVSEIYASHVLEYYSWEDVREVVLPEWRRILGVKKRIRIAVPDFDVVSKMYQAGMPLKWFIGPLFGRMEAGGGLIYHKSTFDFRTVQEVLFEAGFRDARRYNWEDTEYAGVDDYSKCYIPHMRDDGILLSLNVEAWT